MRGGPVSRILFRDGVPVMAIPLNARLPARF